MFLREPDLAWSELLICVSVYVSGMFNMCTNWHQIHFYLKTNDLQNG